MKQSASSHDGISGLKVSKNMGLCVIKREREIRIVSENERMRERKRFILMVENIKVRGH